MASTTIHTNMAQAVKLWSAKLTKGFESKSYFTKFTGMGPDSIVHKVEDFKNKKGDQLNVDLVIELRKSPTVGDASLMGNEEELKFFNDTLFIDQVRHGVKITGRMTTQRTLHNLFDVAQESLGSYFARMVDQLIFIYLSGARGVNQDFVFDTSFAGISKNPLIPMDAAHMMYAGSALSKATLTTADQMSKIVIERALTKAKTIRSSSPDTAGMMPLTTKDGKETSGSFVMVMSPEQEFSLRNNDTVGWADVQKAAAAQQGASNPIFTGALGLLGGVVLHSHTNVVRFPDGGALANVPVARALFLSRQAASMGFIGRGTDTSFELVTEKTDYENSTGIAGHANIGVKRSIFNNQSFGCIAVDTAYTAQA